MIGHEIGDALSKRRLAGPVQNVVADRHGIYLRTRNIHAISSPIKIVERDSEWRTLQCQTGVLEQFFSA